MKRKRPKTALLFSLLLLFILFTKTEKSGENAVASNTTKHFIEQNFINENGTIATYIHDTQQLDNDFVRGREALAETLGLWMEYAVLMEDEAMFADAIDVLQHFFMEKDGFIHWKLLEDGKSNVTTNAFVDDLRIIRALLEANRLWPSPSYHDIAMQISHYVTAHQERKGVWTDFYDKKYELTSDKLTLSYVETDVLKQMDNQQLMPREIYQQMLQVLIDLPDEDGFFPKYYHTEEKNYVFDEEVNMIDQALIALNLVNAELPTERFQAFLWEEIEKNQVIYGKYNRKSTRAAVDYESPAVYGFLIMYSLEVKDEELTKRLYDNMKSLQVQDGKYKGAYALEEGNAHVFDQLVPLLAETKMQQAGVMP